MLGCTRTRILDLGPYGEILRDPSAVEPPIRSPARSPVASQASRPPCLSFDARSAGAPRSRFTVRIPPPRATLSRLGVQRCTSLSSEDPERDDLATSPAI